MPCQVPLRLNSCEVTRAGELGSRRHLHQRQLRCLRLDFDLVQVLKALPDRSELIRLHRHHHPGPVLAA